MIIKKIKEILIENRKSHKKNNLLLKELDWANVYHDSIRGKEYLQQLKLNIGRWAGNYTFFYILNRILDEYKPKKILELGLGESSKFISCYLDNYLLESSHLIVEHDRLWKDKFKRSFLLSKRSSIIICPIEIKNIDGNEVNSYSGIEEVKKKFDLYVIDGPFGSENISRIEILQLMENINDGDEFMIIMDDYQRIGEQNTIKKLLKLFENKNIDIYYNSYFGNKAVFAIGTLKYKFIESL